MAVLAVGLVIVGAVSLLGGGWTLLAVRGTWRRGAVNRSGWTIGAFGLPRWEFERKKYVRVDAEISTDEVVDLARRGRWAEPAAALACAVGLSWVLIGGGLAAFLFDDPAAKAGGLVCCAAGLWIAVDWTRHLWRSVRSDVTATGATSVDD